MNVVMSRQYFTGEAELVTVYFKSRMWRGGEVTCAVYVDEPGSYSRLRGRYRRVVEGRSLCTAGVWM